MRRKNTPLDPLSNSNLLIPKSSQIKEKHTNSKFAIHIKLFKNLKCSRIANEFYKCLFDLGLFLIAGR